MRTIRILGLIGAGVIAASLLSTAAEARPHCVWQGNHWRCWDQGSRHGAWDSGRHHKRAEMHHDRRRVHRLEKELNRDIRSGSSTREIRRDMRKLNRAKRELREDRLGY